MTPADRPRLPTPRDTTTARALRPERRVDPGVNVNNPERVTPKSLTPPVKPFNASQKPSVLKGR